jgi:hypothetical protein
MTLNALHARFAAHGAAVLAAMLCSQVACKDSSGPPSLPKLPTLPGSAGRQKAPTPVGYRSQSGSPIAPSVIPDDPPPTQVQPVTNPGASARATLNGDPNGITRDTLNRSIQGAMGSLAACFSSLNQDPMVSVSFEAEPSGRPSLVRVGGAPPDAERCIRNVVQNIRFPSFDGKGVQVDLPLSFHRVPRPAQQENPSEESQAPAGASLFLQP